MEECSASNAPNAQPTLSPTNGKGAMDVVLPIFARHETFHPRYGWLKKGMDLVQEEAGVFSTSDAMVKLGVGKNMVNAIRFWCQAFKVIEPTDSSRRSQDYTPARSAQELLGDNRWDPYLEDPGSLWLLHWWLLKPPCHAAAWYYAFNLLNKMEFTIDELFSALEQWARAKFPSSRFAESSLKKDAACIVRMYTDGDSLNSQDIETISSPFADLRLLEKLGNSTRYSFNVGPKPNLPAEIIAVACLDFISSDPCRPTVLSDKTRGAMAKSLSALLYDEGSPGLAFKLTESALYNALDSTSRVHGSFSIQDSAGILQVVCRESPSGLSSKILEDYYSRRQPCIE